VIAHSTLCAYAEVVDKRKLPSICLDEHIRPELKAIFRDDGFRVFRANESRYRGRDERDYLDEMYARNEVFVTSDGDFVNDLVESRVKRHAGVVWMPEQLDKEQQDGFAELAASSIKFQVGEEGQFAIRGLVLYPSKDGLTVFDGDKDQLIISWARMAL
jgi:hypothetical protein